MLYEWKRVKVENYYPFENEIINYKYQRTDELLDGLNGMLTIWDDKFDEHVGWSLPRYDVQYCLDFRSNQISFYME
jgi:hypothetical protein